MRGCRCVTKWVRPGTWQTQPCFLRPMKRISLPASRSRSMAAPWSTSTERACVVSCESLARELRALAELIDLEDCAAPPRRRHAAVGTGYDAFLGEVFRRLANDRGHLVWALNLLARHVDGANLHVLAVEKPQQADRNAGISALDRDLPDPALGKRRENLLVLAPFAAERCLPVDVGLDAVAVANVNGGGAGQALDRAVQRVDAPRLDLPQIDIEGRFVELNDIHAVGLERTRLGVEEIGERHRHLRAVAVMGIRDRIDDGHRSRQRELELALGVGACELRLSRVHARLEAKRTRDGGYHRLVAVGADADLDLAREIDPIDEFEKAMHEMLARLLAVGDDVDAAILLQLEREHRRVALGVREGRAGGPPGGPQSVGLGEPGRLRQAAGDGGCKERHAGS